MAIGIGTVLAIGSAISGGVGKWQGNKRGKEAESQASKALQEQMNYLGKSTDMLDRLQPTIDKFAEQGQGQYDKYNKMFGGMEQSLANYYNDLDPDQYAAQGNQTAQQQYQQSNKMVNDQLAAQGINNSGVQAQLGYQNANTMAQTKSQNIMDAPAQVAQQQQGWMNYGAGRQDNAWNQMQQGVNAQSGMTNQYNQAYNNMANAYGQQSANANQAAQNAYGQGNKAFGQGMAGLGYFGNKAGWFSNGGDGEVANLIKGGNAGGGNTGGNTGGGISGSTGKRIGGM